MYKVHAPEAMNQAFVMAFNNRKIDIILSLYADDAVLVTDSAGQPLFGKESIRKRIEDLLELSDTMTSRDTLCMAHKDLALLCADVDLRLGKRVISTDKMSALVRRDPNGHWLYAGATLPGI
ncbi:nuclear transport factor 2 family protein [Caulobacter segnis]|uniref:YybH family protein n=1 Tax=Caulobacter segnis TaxID=88688 RepID=UPI00285D4DC9|nr:nuclear transport factor 2 family protein [Caulobacter segnis]MDR6626297.1 ketosteroid isomerase-like protein [Caulobacter segnis]